jgi:hypothetical protein
MADFEWTNRVRKRLVQKNKTARGVREIQFSLRKPRGITISGTWTASTGADKPPAVRPKYGRLIVTTVGLVIFAWLLICLLLNRTTDAANSVSLQKHTQSTSGVIDRG